MDYPHYHQSPSGIDDDNVDDADYYESQNGAFAGDRFIYDDYGEDGGFFPDGDVEFFEDTFSQPDSRSQFVALWEDCTLPILSQSLSSVTSLTLLSLALTCLGSYGGLSPASLHLSSAGLGLASILLFFPASWHLLVGMALGAGVLYFLAARVFRASTSTTRVSPLPVSISLTLMTAVVCIEFTMDGPTWHALRGPALLMAMKIISVAIDRDRLSFEELFGYLFCPGTVIFGPWIKYSDYAALILSPKRFSLSWLSHFLSMVFFSFLALFSSVCVASVLLTRIDAPLFLAGLPPFVVIWLAAYRDAFSFRASHYFVCFTSQATLMARGAGMDHDDYDDSHGRPENDANDNRNERPRNETKRTTATSRKEVPFVDERITNPWKVELPRSLVEVVVYWNVPTHRWLKNYVFRPSLPVIGTPVAILATYAVSSLLHGLNFQLAAVLFSLGFYSYAEHVLRAKLARIFDACVMARPCHRRAGGCLHAHKEDAWMVKLTNIAFAIVAIFHLAYLGVAFDNSDEQSRGYSMRHVLAKWARLNYASPILALGFFGFSLLV